MKLRCIAVDDEPLALDIIQDYIERVPFLQFDARFTSAIEAIDHLQRREEDLIFLDIQMEDLTGIQMLRIVPKLPQVIFTTAYESYAIKGYELDVTDYLLKPISFERFLMAANKAYERHSSKLNAHENISPEMLIHNPRIDYFFVRTEHRLQKINFRDILYIEGQGDYLRIVTAAERIMTLQNFKQMEEVLPIEQFVRIHRSYIIALDKIDSIERNRVKIGGQLLPLSDTYRDGFFSILRSRGIL